LDAFDLAIRQLPVSRLRFLAVRFRKNFSHCVTRDDYVNLFSSLSKPKRLEALKKYILAGRTSMALFSNKGDKEVEFKVNFSGRASEAPTIVTVGKKDEIIRGLQHVQWTMTDGQASYLDTRLELQVEPEAIVVDTFYDAKSKILQIRGGHTESRKIGRQWAAIQKVDFETMIKPQGITTLEGVHNFCDAIDGHVRKGTGDQRESKGFRRVSGMRDSDVADLRGTDDYEEFVERVDMVESQIDFEHNGVPVLIGVGLQSMTIVFKTNASEDVIDHTYKKLKKFLNI
jgi:hypothetical protein